VLRSSLITATIRKSVVAFLAIISVLFVGQTCRSTGIEEAIRLVELARFSDASDAARSWVPKAAHVAADESVYLILMLESRSPGYRIVRMRQSRGVEPFQDPEWFANRGLLIAFAVSRQKQFYNFVPDSTQVHSEIWVWDGSWARLECGTERPRGFVCDQLQLEDVYVAETYMVDRGFSRKLTRVSEGEPRTVELPVSQRIAFVTDVWLVGEIAYYLGYSKPSSEFMTRVYFCRYNSDSEESSTKLIWEQPYPTVERAGGLGTDSWLISSGARILLGFEGKMWSFRSSASGLELEAVRESLVPLHCKFLPNPAGLPLYIDHEDRILTLRIEREQT